MVLASHLILGCAFSWQRCATPDGSLAGYVSGDAIYSGGEEEMFLGEVDRGRGYIKGASGSSVLELDATGHCKGATAVYLGQFRGCSYGDIDVVAMCVLCFLPHFVREDDV